MRRLAVTAALLMAAAVAFGMAGHATFAASTGFSGRYGFDCSSCHTVAAPTPPAVVVVQGVPTAWEAATTYTFTIRIEGGPPAVPALQPQGGFEADTDTGRFLVAPGMEGLTRTFGGSGITYTEEGTLTREWHTTWTTPSIEELDGMPPDAHVWIAVVAANGNHVMATNVSDGGESGDAVATWHESIPPSSSVWAAWQARQGDEAPEQPPEAERPTPWPAGLLFTALALAILLHRREVA